MFVSKNPRAFTLLEVVITIVIMGIVAISSYASFAAVYKTEDEHRARQVAEAYEARVRTIAVDVSADPQENVLKDAESPTSYLNTATSSFSSDASFSGILDNDTDASGIDDDGYVTLSWKNKVTVCIDFLPTENPNTTTNPTAPASVPAIVSIGACS